MSPSTYTTTVKTTIEIDQSLLKLAKLRAIQQNQTLKEIINQSLANNLGLKTYDTQGDSNKMLTVSDTDDLLSYAGTLKPKTKPENYQKVRRNTMKAMTKIWAKD